MADSSRHVPLLNEPLFKRLESVLKEHGAAGRRGSEIAELECLKGQPSGRRDRVLEDLTKIGPPIYSKTVGSEVVYYYDDIPIKKACRGVGPKKNTGGKRKVPNGGARGAAGGKAKKVAKKSQVSRSGGIRIAGADRSKKKASSDSDEDDGSAFDSENEDESSDEDDDDEDDGEDEDDANTSSSDDSIRGVKRSKGAKSGSSGGVPQKRKGGSKKITWLLAEDAALLCAFLKKIAKHAGKVSESELPFLSTTNPTTYVHMVTKLVAEKDFHDVGLRRSFAASQARVSDLLASFETVGAIASFVLLGMPRAKKGTKQMLQKFLSLSLPGDGDTAGAAKENPFTAGLRNQYCADGVSLDRDAKASSASLVEFGWFDQQGRPGSSFEDCFNARIAPTYKTMMQSRRDGGKEGVCESILQSYGSSVRSGKEVSTTEGLLAAHNVFAGATYQAFDDHCFTKVSIKLSKKEDESFEMKVPDTPGGYKKSKLIASEKKSSSKTGHYDKPINRIQATMGFGKGGGDGGGAKTSSSSSSSSSASATKKRSAGEISLCPWLEKDGSINSSLFDLFTSKVISILASFPGASLEFVHSFMAILNRQQFEAVLRSMEENKLVRKQTPNESVKIDSLFGERIKNGPTGEATFYIY